MTAHVRMLQLRIGIAPIPLDAIVMHPHHRPPDETHVLKLTSELSQDASTRWAHPIDVIVHSGVDKTWLASLQKKRLLDTPPTPASENEDPLFWCISGQHRVLAAKRLLEDGPRRSDDEMNGDRAVDREMAYWPANVYDAAAFEEGELQLWMTERNTQRVSLKSTLRQRLIVLETLALDGDVDLQRRALDLLGWYVTDTSAIISLYYSDVWQPLMHVLAESLYADVASGNIIDWAISYRAYPILAQMPWDIPQQQEQLRMRKKDVKPPVNMDFFFGPSWSQNQLIPKSGIRSNISKAWTRAIKNHFKAESFHQFWEAVTRREIGRDPLLPVNSPFLYDQIIPTVLDMNYRATKTPFSDRLHRCEYAASLVHLLIPYPNLREVPFRRPKRHDLEVDWVDLVDKHNATDRIRGQQVLLHLLINVDTLAPKKQNLLQGPISAAALPHMVVHRKPATIDYVLRETMSAAWTTTILYCAELGLHVSPMIERIRERLQQEVIQKGRRNNKMDFINANAEEDADDDSDDSKMSRDASRDSSGEDEANKQPGTRSQSTTTGSENLKDIHEAIIKSPNPPRAQSLLPQKPPDDVWTLVKTSLGQLAALLTMVEQEESVNVNLRVIARMRSRQT
ncbi:hypothetical protein M408DRAFT_28935 [Serendipita vermifera MAFF 305830]|uniref:Uncharacterized protein n=1 Tax=Serendipita vermifera MAFF 305830 TaxID=933852 RepID=A0A0C2WY25_SERVB|nr:hypothetical protein M408DRAFT_28935 [Serendipita vermifera MAFF 305830]